MKEKVKCYRKCLKCGKIDTYIMRDKNVNNIMKDNDIINIILSAVHKPYHVDHCKYCNIQAMFMYVGWDY